MDPSQHSRNLSVPSPDRPTLPYALQHSPSPSPSQRGTFPQQQQQQSPVQARRPTKANSSQRVASGSGSGASPGDADVHSTSDFGDAIIGKDEARRLAQRLATRLQYAAFKVERGWTKHSLSEVENLYWRASKARISGAPALPVGSSSLPSTSGSRNTFKESLERVQNRRRTSQPKASSHADANGTGSTLLPGFSHQTEAPTRPQAPAHRPTPPIVIRRSSSQHQSQHAPSVNVRIKRYSPELARHMQHQKRRRTSGRQGSDSADDDADADADDEDDIFGPPPQGQRFSPEPQYTQRGDEGGLRHGHANGGLSPTLPSMSSETARKVSGGSVLGPAGVPTPPPSAGTVDASSRSDSGASTTLLRSNNPSHLRASPTRNTQAHVQTQSRNQTPSSGQHVLQAGPSPFTSAGAGAGAMRSDSTRGTHTTAAAEASSPPTYADFWSKLASGPRMPSPSRASLSPETTSPDKEVALKNRGART